MRSTPIWLIGHSYPLNWVDQLDGPLDPRHPTRHSIWTPVLDQLQQYVYRNGEGRRLNMDRCFVDNVRIKGDPEEIGGWDWKSEAMLLRAKDVQRDLTSCRPKIVITFGDEVYRFTSAVRDGKEPSASKMTMPDLANCFNAAVQAFDPEATNILPLLHASVARRSWSTAGKDYAGSSGANYFTHAGEALARLLLEFGKDWDVWESH
jgi:hypothetical protein